MNEKEREEYIELCAKRRLLKNSLSAAARKLRGTKESSVHPDSIGDRILSCLIGPGSNVAEIPKFLALGEALLAEAESVTKK